MAKKTISSPNPIWLAGGIVLLGLGLAWVSTGFVSLQGWVSFVLAIALMGLVYWLAWRNLASEQLPRWLLGLTVGAALFRLVLGAVWLVALPVGGHDTDVQRAGYVMQDAYNRDQAAWQLAESDEPLVAAFSGYSITDQYGGLLFISAALYRYFGGAVHQPLLALVPAAAVSGLAVAFAWAATRRAFGKQVALWAAWGLALYPEAALLGSSQMREAFTVCLLPVALLGLQRVLSGQRRGGLTLLAVAFISAAILSWPFIASLLLFLLVCYLALTEWRVLRDRRVQIGLAVAAVLALLYVWLFVNLREQWLVQSAAWQVYVSASGSGWIARQFRLMPEWVHIPFLVLYGLVRPLLPAALVARGLLVWDIIGIWRALGWTVLLALLLYATYLVWRKRAWLQLPGALLLFSWAVSLVASYRAGGDMWDNPRYRSAFAAIQVMLAAWAWFEHKRGTDPWLRRALVGAGLMCASFLLWYIRRYFGLDWWPIVEIYQVVGIGLASCALYLLWDWLRA